MIFSIEQEDVNQYIHIDFVPIFISSPYISHLYPIPLYIIKVPIVY